MSYDTRLVTDLRQLLTLRQHYYPELNQKWSWIILMIAVSVQCLSHGLHMSSGIFVASFISQFNENLLTTGIHLLHPLLLSTQLHFIHVSN